MLVIPVIINQVVILITFFQCGLRPNELFLKKFFFRCGPFSKVFIEFVTLLLLFYVLFFLAA